MRIVGAVRDAARGHNAIATAAHVVGCKIAPIAVRQRGGQAVGEMRRLDLARTAFAVGPVGVGLCGRFSVLIPNLGCTAGEQE